MARPSNNAKHSWRCRTSSASFDAYVWRFVDGKPIVNTLRGSATIPRHTDESDALSKDLKQRGFRSSAPRSCYAHMQATGMVNDHAVDCFRRSQVRTQAKKG